MSFSCLWKREEYKEKTTTTLINHQIHIRGRTHKSIHRPINCWKHDLSICNRIGWWIISDIGCKMGKKWPTRGPMKERKKMKNQSIDKVKNDSLFDDNNNNNKNNWIATPQMEGKICDSTIGYKNLAFLFLLWFASHRTWVLLNTAYCICII